MSWWLITLFVLVGFLVLVAIYDVTQRKHAILRAFPVVGHLRYWLEKIGPELRQYIVTDNNEERPFSRDQRRWIYATAKEQNPYFGFGTDNHIDAPGYLFIKHSPFPLPPSPINGHHDAKLPSPKVMGALHNRAHAFRPTSIVNISAMSYGSLSSAAIQALNQGAARADLLHNTGEGGISKFHRSGGKLIFQIGTGYFGCRNVDGSFSLDILVETVQSAPVKAIEIKLSQGAKPGLGGVLPGAKVTAQIAEARGVPEGETVESPNHHSAFSDIDSMIDFIELVADATGLPVGIKSAIGQVQFWDDLAARMVERGEGPDFITVDGGEGGTGAAPLVFADHVALPVRFGLSRVYRTFAKHDLQRDITFIAAGKAGFPDEALALMTLGADMINVAREAMIAIGCVQAQKCHTGHCPTGVATQNSWLVRGLDAESKGERMGNYAMALRDDLDRISRACGVTHPALVPFDTIEMNTDGATTAVLSEHFGLDPSTVRLHASDVAAISAESAVTL